MPRRTAQIQIAIEHPGSDRLERTNASKDQGELDPGTVRSLLHHTITETLQDQGVSTAQISLTLLDDRSIAEINNRYLGHDGPTDVIAFALHRFGAPAVGDLYIGYDQALRQAHEHGVEPYEELARLAVHGTLHVLGHDHPEGEDRYESPMWTRQETILDRLRETWLEDDTRRRG